MEYVCSGNGSQQQHAVVSFYRVARAVSFNQMKAHRKDFLQHKNRSLRFVFVADISFLLIFRDSSFHHRFASLAFIIQPTRARSLARDCVFHNYRWAAVQRQACVRIYALAHSLDYMAANQLHKKELRIIVKSNKITRQETRNRCENMRRFYISPSFIQQSNRISRFTAGFHIILVSLRLRVVSVCAKCCEIKTKPDLFDFERVIVAIATSLT